MNAGAFRQFYAYHFAENRKVWARYVTQLTEEQFLPPTGYSQGTDRRAQLRRLLNDLGVNTVYQDYAFSVYEDLYKSPS